MKKQPSLGQKDAFRDVMFISPFAPNPLFGPASLSQPQMAGVNLV
jgi:hypothetical protein